MIRILRWSKSLIPKSLIPSKQTEGTQILGWEAKLQVDWAGKSGQKGLVVSGSELGIHSLRWQTCAFSEACIFPEDWAIEDSAIKGSASLVAEAMPELLLQLHSELRGYFAGVLQEFRLPLNLGGTPSQLELWQELGRIGYGQTLCYQDIASKLGRPRAVRAVARAIAANPMHILIPCHRVIAKNGQLCGYAGGLECKENLLALEGRLKVEE